MNRVCLTGRFVRNPELRENEKVKQVSFTIAVPRRYVKDGPSADFIKCVAWGNLAETIEKYCVKGKEVAVEGRMETNSYEDKEGNKRYSTNVVLDNITFMGSKKDEEEKKEESDPFKEFSEEVELSDDELPF